MGSKTRDAKEWNGLLAVNEKQLKVAVLYNPDFISIAPTEYMSAEEWLIKTDGSASTKWVRIGCPTDISGEVLIPARVWVEDIVGACRRANIPVFMKETLRELMGGDFVQEFPDGLCHE